MVIRPLGAKNICGKMFLPLKMKRHIALTTYITNKRARPIAIDFKLNIEPTDTDQPKIMKKKVLTTKADSPVTTLKSDNMLSTFVSSISFERPPEKKNL